MSDAQDISAEQAREIVLNVSRRRGYIHPKYRQSSSQGETSEEAIVNRSLREELGDVIEQLSSDVYSQQNHFILELIQNSEDCKFTHTNRTPAITFEVSPQKIVVECNEDGFTETDVKQICYTAKSWKKGKPGYVGEKGIGFKSVFQVASKVHVQSNWFSFSFEYNGEPESEKKLGMVTPIPETDCILLSERPLTRITLTLNNKVSYDEVVSRFTTLPDTLLLFLSKLKEIRIKIHLPHQRNITTIFRKSDEDAGITRLTKISGTPEAVDERHYIVTKTKVSELPDNAARPNINECEIVFAFPVANNRPLASLQVDIFAFLPVCTVGFNFLLQADFILQAGREAVMVDSPWNIAVVDEAANAFCHAMLDFCQRPILRYSWMKYLPVGNAFNSNPLWRRLSAKVISLLQEKDILYYHPHDIFAEELGRPNALRTLPSNYLDKDRSPLFIDRPGSERSRRYLSLHYKQEGTQILKKAFNIPDIKDSEMFHIIDQDLKSPESKLKDPETESDWHTRAADLIIYIFGRSQQMKTKIKEELPLMPLNDGRWVTASAGNIFFPAETGPAIPRDLVVTIQPEATRNASRMELFRLLGARKCSVTRVVDELWRLYSRGNGASNLDSSKAHVAYLYWHADIKDRGFSRFWLYDHHLRKVTPHHKTIYLPSNDEYGAQRLLSGGPDPRDPRKIIPECPVSFVHNAYMIFPSHTPLHDLSWLDWFETCLRALRVPRLKYDAGSLSYEIRHIIRYRPDKTVGTLKKYWRDYKKHLTPGTPVVEEISQCEVACLDAPKAVLSRTYFPVQTLMHRAQALGIIGGFQFLAIPSIAGHDSDYQDWRFLEMFGVKFTENILFYLDILRQHEQRDHQAWNSSTRSAIVKIYELIADEYSARNKDMVLETFYQEDLILHPNSFKQNSTAAAWLDAESCVWRGPEDILDKAPLATVLQYRNNKKFFCEILGIKNANWHDYMDTLLKLRNIQTSPSDLWDKLLELYVLLSKCNLREEEWGLVSDNFEERGLIYVQSDDAWFAPSQCLWTSPVPIEGRAIIGISYPVELKSFFCERLRISPASVGTLVEGLCSLAQRQPSLAALKQMIWAINDMDPKESDLEVMMRCNILPVRGDRSSPDRPSLQNCRSNFVIIDRAKLADYFSGHIGFLDFSLEEVRQLDPFLKALKLGDKYLSCICMEVTACSEDRTLDRGLTTEFVDRAYSILRCAVSNRSPLTLRSPLPIYNRLLATTVFKSDGISTQYTIKFQNGESIGPIVDGTSHLHIQEDEFGWQIFVPRNKHSREVSYRIALPDTLTKLLKINQAARESIGYVLNSSTLVIDDILEHAGISQVPGIEPPPRRIIAYADEEESEVEVRESSENEIIVAPDQISLEASDEINTALRNAPWAVTSYSSEIAGSRGRASISLPNIPSGPSSAYPGRDELYRNAYLELLINVIRIAGQTVLPHNGALPSPGNGPLHQNFNHEAAFGIRSQGEMSHDMKIGAAGELFIYECLRNMGLPSFDYGNWRSTIRREVTIHPRYSDMGIWTGRETSDFVYRDKDGVLTKFLIDTGYLDQVIWIGATPKYFIEVKTTTGEYSDRFFMSGNQYRMMGRMALEGRVSDEIYLICRVYNLGKENLNAQVFVDPWAHRGRRLAFEAQTWTVTPS